MDKINKLITEAKNIIELRYCKGKHSVGAALQTKSGKIYTGISLNGQKLNLCAEWFALNRAFTEGENEIDSIVAVHRKKDGTFELYPPCGLCRELFITYCPDAEIILSDTETRKASELLPSPWTK